MTMAGNSKRGGKQETPNGGGPAGTESLVSGIASSDSSNNAAGIEIDSQDMSDFPVRKDIDQEDVMRSVHRNQLNPPAEVRADMAEQRRMDEIARQQKQNVATKPLKLESLATGSDRGMLGIQPGNTEPPSPMEFVGRKVTEFGVFERMDIGNRVLESAYKTHGIVFARAVAADIVAAYPRSRVAIEVGAMRRLESIARINEARNVEHTDKDAV
jgi:hypothetical protein